MFDNIRVVAWLFFCLFIELLVVAMVAPLHDAERDALWKSPIVFGTLARTTENTSGDYVHQ